MSLVNTADIISKFELYIGDETELSSSEKLDLVQKIYNKVLASDEWEFLKTEATGSVAGTTIAQEADFDRLLSEPIIYLGTANREIVQIPFGARRGVTNTSGYFYYDAANTNLVLTKSESETFSYDYIKVPPALDTTSSNPLIPVRFYDMIFHGMCVDSDIINLSDKARSYAAVNQGKYQEILADAQSWNKKISGFSTYGI
jgi:hypothetical protein